MENLIEKFESKLVMLSDEQLVARFNREVGSHGWVSARANFLFALRNQFEQRAIDYSIVRNESGGFNLCAKVILKDGELIF
jgi:hypothetical protein